MGFPGGALVKNPLANARDVRDAGSVPESGRLPGVGDSSPLQYSCLEDSSDGGSQHVTAHGVAKSQT